MKIKCLELSFYLALETKISEILGDIEELNEMLTHYSELSLQRTNLPQFDVEEPIFKLMEVKNELTKLDLSPYIKIEKEAS